MIYTNIYILEVWGPSGARLLACGPSGRLWALRACLTSSFAPFGRSGRVTHAAVSMMVSIMHVSVILIVDDACMYDACIHDACIHDECIHDVCIHDVCIHDA